MDGKKTNLTPELKEIYDRVMNTSNPSAAAKPQASAPTAPTAANPLDAPSAIAPNGNQTPIGASPIPNTQPAMGAVQEEVGAQPMANPMPGMPTMPEPLAAAPTPAEQALSSTPARPLSEGNTFAFNGGSHPAPGPAASGTTAKKKSKISLPILIVLGIAFLGVWGVFWAIIFGFIQR